MFCSSICGEGVHKSHGIPEFFCGHIRSIWDDGRHYRQGAGKKGDARRRKKEAKGISKEDLKTEKTKNN